MAYGDPTGVNKILVEKYGYEWVNGKAWRPGIAPEPEPTQEEPVAATPSEPSQPVETPIEEPASSEPISLEERIEQLQASINELQKKYEEALEKLEQANTRIAELEGQQSETSSEGSNSDDAAIEPDETPSPAPQQPTTGEEVGASTPEAPGVSEPEPTPAPSYPEPTGVDKILVENYGYEWVNGKAWKPGTAPDVETVSDIAIEVPNFDNTPVSSGVPENGSPPSGLPGASLNKGSLTATTSTLFDRTLDVYGVKLLVGGASGTQDAVPDAWAHKVAQSYVMLMDPTGSNIDVSAQENMKEILSGADGTWHEGFGTSQRILKGTGSEYPLNPLQDLNEGQLDAQYGAGTEALLHDIMQDMVWYQNSTGVINSGDGDIQELFEHVLHTLHPWGVRGAVEGSQEALNYTKVGLREAHDANDSSWKTSELYLAMKEAMDNGVFDPSGYTPDPLNDPEQFHPAATEYTYILNFSMWEMGKEFWPDKVNDEGALEGEWSVTASDPAGVLAENPLGHALFMKYFDPVLSKPDFATLRSMFQDNDQGDSGYVPDATPSPAPQQPAEVDEAEAVQPESNSTEVTVRNNELDLNNEYFSADFQISMNRSEVLRVDGYDSDILIMVMAASTNSESTLFNTEAIPARAMAYDDVNGLVEVSSEILFGNPKSVLTRNIILGDYDGNGHIDVFLNNHGTEGIIPFPGETNQLLLNLDGKLVTSEFNLPTFNDFSHNGSSGDYNNDGYDDVFIINFGSAGLNADYVLFGSKQGFSSPLFLRGYTPEGETLVPGSYSNYASQMPASVSIDIGQDGYDEMVGPLKIQASDDTPQFIGISLKNTALAETTELGISWRGSSEGAHQARTADLNGDGYQDGVFLGFTEAGETLFQILLSSEDGIIDGNSGFGEDSGVFEASQGNLDFKLIDYDSDGDLDILFRSWDEHWQPFGVGFQNDGNAQFTKIEFPLLIPETAVVFDTFQSNDESQLLVYGEGAKISAIPSKLIPSSEVVNLQPTPVVELRLAEVESAPTGVSKLLVENYGYSWIEGKHYSSGNAPELELEGDTIHTVTVSKVGNQNVFFIDGNSNPDFIIEAGKTYRFDQSDASNANHPLNFLSEDGADISSFVEVTGTAGTAGAYVDLRFDAGNIANIDGPELSYYCELHGAAMGNDIEVQNIIA